MARVELGKFSYASNSFVDGKTSFLPAGLPGAGQQCTETANGVIYATMDSLKKSFPKDIDYVVPFESVTVVKVSIHEVVNTLLDSLGTGYFCGVSVSAKLARHAYSCTWLFRYLLSVHLSFLSHWVLPSIRLTMFGFVLAIGIVVDDAIVVVEAVQHYIDDERHVAKEATYKA